MAFDGFTTAALTAELSDKLTGARILRIIQPEADELLLTIRPLAEKGGGQVRLCLSADPSLPLCYLTEENKPAPMSAPSFCMLLRKYLQNGRIVRVTQPGLERIIRFEIEHLNEMGDLCSHVLVIELMGKHSNIIFLDRKRAGGEAKPAAGDSFHAGNAAQSSSSDACGADPADITSAADADEIIVDSIRRISQMVSSVREVLPGRPYFIPETQGKHNPFEETKEHFFSLLSGQSVNPSAFLVRTYTGFSNVAAEECTFRSRVGQERSVSAFSDEEKEAFWSAFSGMLGDAKAGRFSPAVYYHIGRADDIAQGEPVEYAAFTLSMYRDLPAKRYDSMSVLLENYYREKNAVTRIRQKSSDLRRIVTTILERDVHKYDLQKKQLKDTEKREKYRVFGELLNTYGYEIPEGAKSAELDNYYTGEKLTVPLDPTKTPQENAQHYFDRYTKLKRTKEALDTLMKDVKGEIDQLESIRNALNISADEADLSQIRKEMEASGFVKSHDSARRKGAARTPEAKPLHFISSDGYDILVGKNNTQNDELTFRTARATDIWFHANDMPGSHVILRTEGRPFEQIPDRAFEEAARLAAYYSSGRDAGLVEVDYLEKRGVKKPAGARPGFVLYHSNYSINVKPDITGIRRVDGLQ